MIKRDLDYQRAFGLHLKKLREEKNLTQSELEALSLVNETQISKIEGGEHGPNFHTIVALATALGKRPGELFDFKFDLNLNKEFPSESGIHAKVGTTSLIKQLVADRFFHSPRSVSDVIKKCKTKYGVELASADTSGVLLKLVKSKTLRQHSSDTVGKHLYESR